MVDTEANVTLVALSITFCLLNHFELLSGLMEAGAPQTIQYKKTSLYVAIAMRYVTDQGS